MFETLVILHLLNHGDVSAALFVVNVITFIDSQLPMYYFIFFYSGVVGFRFLIHVKIITISITKQLAKQHGHFLEILLNFMKLYVITTKKVMLKVRCTLNLNQNLCCQSVMNLCWQTLLMFQIRNQQSMLLCQRERVF